ncbi:MAG: hypothetical protein V1731_02490 [Candidatus Aenigmatarchaeota archaeon]
MGYARDAINTLIDKASFRVSVNTNLSYMRINNRSHFLPIHTIYMEAPKYIGMLCASGLQIADSRFYPKPPPNKSEKKCLFYYLSFGKHEEKAKEPVMLVNEESLRDIDNLDVLISPFFNAMDHLEPLIRVVREKDIEWMRMEQKIFDAHPIETEKSIAIGKRLFQMLFDREYEPSVDAPPLDAN